MRSFTPTHFIAQGKQHTPVLSHAAKINAEWYRPTALNRFMINPSNEQHSRPISMLACSRPRVSLELSTGIPNVTIDDFFMAMKGAETALKKLDKTLTLELKHL